MKELAILIPAYQPGAELISMAAELSRAIGNSIFVVDDGSDVQYQDVFDELRCCEDISVLRHPTNLGKGAAIKTGLRAVLERDREIAGVIVVDCDGQHSIDSVAAVVDGFNASTDTLVLGVRAISVRIPLLSYVGNLLSNILLFVVTGAKYSDSQTGLRAIPSAAFDHYLKVRTNHFDYEMETLLHVATVGIPILEVPIKTIYHDAKHRSHFRPLLDSSRIAFVILRFACSKLGRLLRLR